MLTSILVAFVPHNKYNRYLQQQGFGAKVARGAGVFGYRVVTLAWLWIQFKLNKLNGTCITYFVQVILHMLLIVLKLKQLCSKGQSQSKRRLRYYKKKIE